LTTTSSTLSSKGFGSPPSSFGTSFYSSFPPPYSSSATGIKGSYSSPLPVKGVLRLSTLSLYSGSISSSLTNLNSFGLYLLLLQ